MTTLRVALAQLDPAIGDLAGNSAKIVLAATKAREAGARVVLFGELAITAYGPKDLLDRPSFVADVEHACAKLAVDLPHDVVAIVGAPTRAQGGIGRDVRNSALVM